MVMPVTQDLHKNNETPHYLRVKIQLLFRDTGPSWDGTYGPSLSREAVPGPEWCPPETGGSYSLRKKEAKGI